jgi:hypothetical protein
MGVTPFSQCSLTQFPCSSLSQTHCRRAVRSTFSVVPHWRNHGNLIAVGRQTKSIIIPFLLHMLAWFMLFFRAGSVQQHFILSAIQLPVMHRTQLPSIHSLPRPHTQVRHWLPSVVRKQGLLQSR